MLSLPNRRPLLRENRSGVVAVRPRLVVLGQVAVTAAHLAVTHFVQRRRVGLADVAERLVGARELLDETFGDVCETDAPALHEVGDDQVSRCHRHLAEYDEPRAYRDDSDTILPE